MKIEDFHVGDLIYIRDGCQEIDGSIPGYYFVIMIEDNPNYNNGNKSKLVWLDHLWNKQYNSAFVVYEEEKHNRCYIIDYVMNLKGGEE